MEGQKRGRRNCSERENGTVVISQSQENHLALLIFDEKREGGLYHKWKEKEGLRDSWKNKRSGCRLLLEGGKKCWQNRGSAIGKEQRPEKKRGKKKLLSHQKRVGW